MTLIDLSGKVALVTGGSRGIGAATAIMLARAGADVAFTYRTRKDDAERVGTMIGQVGRQWCELPADLANPDDCSRVVEETVATFNQLDFFVANAAI